MESKHTYQLALRSCVHDCIKLELEGIKDELVALLLRLTTLLVNATLRIQRSRALSGNELNDTIISVLGDGEVKPLLFGKDLIAVTLILTPTESLTQTATLSASLQGVAEIVIHQVASIFGQVLHEFIEQDETNALIKDIKELAVTDTNNHAAEAMVQELDLEDATSPQVFEQMADTWLKKKLKKDKSKSTLLGVTKQFR